MKKSQNTDPASDNFALLSDISHWQTIDVQEQDAAIASLHKVLGKSYKHLYTRKYEAYGANKSPRIPTFKHSSTGLEFNLILGGLYDMGISSAEEKALLAIDQDALFTRDVLPCSVSVRVQPFLMSRLPVLDHFARKFLDIEPSIFRPEFGTNPRDKVPIFLTRREVAALLQRTGFDMPSESQWEYAYRGLAQSLFPFGNKLMPYKDMSKLFLDVFNDQNKCLEAANPFGLVGMYIGDWCQDCFYKDISCTDRHHQPICDGRPQVIRGGASSVWPWQGTNEWTLCISAARWNSDTLEDGTCGVRLVKNLKDLQT